MVKFQISYNKKKTNMTRNFSEICVKNKQIQLFYSEGNLNKSITNYIDLFLAFFNADPNLAFVLCGISEFAYSD